jgi:Leucine-rich repeat (LRR) protein
MPKDDVIFLKKVLNFLGKMNPAPLDILSYEIKVDMDKLKGELVNLIKTNRLPAVIIKDHLYSPKLEEFMFNEYINTSKRDKGLVEFRGEFLPISEVKALYQLENQIYKEFHFMTETDTKRQEEEWNFPNYPEYNIQLTVENNRVSMLAIIGTEVSLLDWIPESIGALTNLRRLYLNGNAIDELPSSMEHLTSLELFSLTQTYKYDSKLHAFPDILCKIKSLKEIYLDNSHIQKIPREIENLTNLEVLSLNNSEITQLPESIGNLKNLKTLDLENCKLTSLPETICDIPSLEEVNIKGNILSELSDKTVKFLRESHLISEDEIIYTTIKKDHSKLLNKIEKITKEKLLLVHRMGVRLSSYAIGGYTGQHYSNEYQIEDNEITGLSIDIYKEKEIPAFLSNLKSLKYLECNGDFTKIPAFLNEFTTLETLKLSGKIEYIENIENLTNLKKLDLSNNEISDLKGLESLTTLTSLDLSRNKISEIKGLELLTNLIVLNLEYNYFTELKGLESLVNLEELKIGDISYYYRLIELNIGNKTSIDKIIEILKEIPRDRILFAQHCVNYCQKKIAEEKKLTFQSVSVRGMDFYVWNNTLKIRKQDIQSINEIKGLENINDLETLDLSFNEIPQIEGLDHLTGLKKLNLSFNKITEIKGLENMRDLEDLNLYDNLITEIKGLNTMKKLENLSLGNNLIYELTGLEELSSLKQLKIKPRGEIKNVFEKLGIIDIKYGLIKDAQKVVEYCRNIKDKPKKKEKPKPKILKIVNYRCPDCKRHDFLMIHYNEKITQCRNCGSDKIEITREQIMK